MPRIATLSVLALLTVVLSGCVSIKSQSALQRLPGFVTLRLEVCASDRDRSTYTTCEPGSNTEEADNGLDGDERSGRGQLLVGFRVPEGTGAPASFVSADRSATFTRNASYRALLDASFPPQAGFRWEGYSSTELPFDPALPDDRTTRLEPEFTLPDGVDGAPFEGPFQWRAVVGFRQTGAGAANPGDPIDCEALGSTVCFDSPNAGVANSLSAAVSDLGVLAGRSASVAQGQTVAVPFPLLNLDGGGLGAHTVTLAASSDVPGATVAPTAGEISVPADGSATASVRVTVPAGKPLGSYTVSLTATSGAAPDLRRSNTATITVVDRQAPAIRVNRPADGATFFVGERVPADYACADGPGGSGVRSCTGPIATGAPLDTTIPGAKTFRVTTSDGAGNTAVATRSYRVVAPPARAPELHAGLRLLARERVHPLHAPAREGGPARRNRRTSPAAAVPARPAASAARAGRPPSPNASGPARSPCAPGSASHCAPAQSSTVTVTKPGASGASRPLPSAPTAARSPERPACAQTPRPPAPPAPGEPNPPQSAVEATKTSSWSRSTARCCTSRATATAAV